MDANQNWYRQLGALMLLSASRAAVEFITNPGSREASTDQLKGAFAEIDYDAIAKALTRAINEVADTSKDRLIDTIDTLRERGVDAVDEAKVRAEDKLAPRRKGKKMRFLIGLVLGGLIAYFLLDEQRRDDLLDRMTGASGPIQQSSWGTPGSGGSGAAETSPSQTTAETPEPPSS